MIEGWPSHRITSNTELLSRSRHVCSNLCEASRSNECASKSESLSRASFKFRASLRDRNARSLDSLLSHLFFCSHLATRFRPEIRRLWTQKDNYRARFCFNRPVCPASRAARGAFSVSRAASPSRQHRPIAPQPRSSTCLQRTPNSQETKLPKNSDVTWTATPWKSDRAPT